MSSKQAPSAANAFVEVYTSNCTLLHKIPAELVSHTPAEHVQNTRLVVCRNYQPGNPGSCVTGERCKYVHVEVALEALEAPTPIHAKHIYHHQSECMYPTLPAGEVLRVSAPNNRMPFEHIASDCVMATRGALNRHVHSGQLSHCAHYTFNKLCKRGPDCHFIHAVAVDPTNVPAGHMRITAKRSWKIRPILHIGCDGASEHAADEVEAEQPRTPVEGRVGTPTSQHSHDEGTPRSNYSESSGSVRPAYFAGKFCRDSPLSSTEAPVARAYRHNPYSLSEPFVYLAW
jgi:hypothetical protein